MSKYSTILEKDDLIVVTGAGGFIGGSLVRYFHDKGYTRIRAIDKKPLPNWYQRVPGVECLSMDLSERDNCYRACENAIEVYNLAADMGGMGFIERFRIMCLRSVLINTYMLEAAQRAGADRYFYSSSACAYNTLLQKNVNVRALKESDAYPAMAERGYGWEKLVSEMFCQEYWAEKNFKTTIARFHNVYGPCFDDKTEVLTIEGWKSFKDVTLMDEIASLNNETKKVEYLRPKEIIGYEYKGDMYEVKAKHISQVITPDHSIYCKFLTTKKDKTILTDWGLIKVKDSKWNRSKMVFSSVFNWEGSELNTITLPEERMSDGRFLTAGKRIDSKLWFEFAGWYISEGSSFITPSNHTVNISQLPGKNQKDICTLITKMGFKPYINGQDIIISSKQLYNNVQQFGKYAENKKIPHWMLLHSKTNLWCLFNSLMKGDGNKTSRRYNTSSKELADNFMELSLKLGYHSMISTEKKMYRIHITNRSELWSNRKTRNIIKYEGTVYDVTLPTNHILMVRRNGKPCWSGNCGTWDGGREKAPAAICRKVIEAKDSGKHEITIWGDGTRTRSFMYIEDCVKGIDMIMHCDKLIAIPINLGSNELVSINQLVDLAEDIGGIFLKRSYDLTAPQGVGGRNSDNTFIKQVFGWEPNISLRQGLTKTYAWIEQQYLDRKVGKQTVRDEI